MYVCVCLYMCARSPLPQVPVLVPIQVPVHAPVCMRVCVCVCVSICVHAPPLPLAPALAIQGGGPPCSTRSSAAGMQCVLTAM